MSTQSFFWVFMKFWIAIAIVVLPAMAQAADVAGIPKIREGDQIQIGNARIRFAKRLVLGREIFRAGGRASLACFA